jgi:NTP pyrophosphatase (non-canonical NTP hydrolase)
MTIRDAQQRVDSWISQYGVRYFNELTNMAILSEEVGEVARIIARKYGEQSPGTALIGDADMADELADVLFVLICIANQTGTDLQDALVRNLEKKTARDFERHQQNDKLR